jgi:hypothetical protein
MDEFARILAIYRHGRLIRSKIVPPNENVEQSGFAAAGTAEQHHELSLIIDVDAAKGVHPRFVQTIDLG